MSKEITSVALDAAYWVTASPHEWEWTKEQQVAMARFCLDAAKTISDAIVDLRKIVCTQEPDDGVVLLSNDAPSHYDPETKCQTYDHQHFSPLGDALIALHKRLSALIDVPVIVPCETCGGNGWVHDRSGNFPSHPGVMAGPFVERMECPTCNGTGRQE